MASGKEGFAGVLTSAVGGAPALANFLIPFSLGGGIHPVKDPYQKSNAARREGEREIKKALKVL